MYDKENFHTSNPTNLDKFTFIFISFTIKSVAYLLCDIIDTNRELSYEIRV